ncbi:unnamed protein product [Arctia plantaginis]|uniref:HMG box domain-containing protein n=1 Tax=Arctia plantaginis TaxID=874455 RepID=A0A8S0Z8K5_ARCPL|nr:unnamed protein product [Arctia plantaginis]CAB3228333.1 unnamed protein product [Arctia plantaginis]
MPKKAPKNAFYYFMLDFKEEQQKKGIHYENLAEVSKAADPEWRNASTSVRAKYENIAKKKRQDRNGPEEKYTSTGIPLSAVEQQQRELQEAREYEERDIRNMIKLKAFNKEDILDEYFYVMDVNYYCKTDSAYVIGESTVLRFNLRNGFRDFYHVNINPGRIPFGYASDVKLGSQEHGLEMPDESAPRSNFMQILANIIDYLRQSEQASNTLPPLYTMPDKVAPIVNFIQQMCQETGEDETIFRVYRLDTMFFTLINAIKKNKNEGFPYATLALSQLNKDMFKYTPRLGCQRHESIDKSVECTTSRTKRWAYTVLDSCCPIMGVEIKAGLHVPLDYNIDGILSYKDKKKVRAAPTVAGVMPSTSSCNSTLNESFLETSMAHSSTSNERPRQEKRSYAPMRMPQADYSRDIRPAPELTEDNFPALSVGAGRGRGLTSSFNKMNIKK